MPILAMHSSTKSLRSTKKCIFHTSNHTNSRLTDIATNRLTRPRGPSQ